MNFFELLNKTTMSKLNPSYKCHVVPQTGFNDSSGIKETRLNQNGAIETNDLFSYKTVQPQPRFAENCKYNGLLSSESSSDDEIDEKKSKVFYKNDEYVITSAVEPGQTVCNDNTAYFDNDQLPFRPDCCLGSYLTTNCSIM